MNRMFKDCVGSSLVEFTVVFPMFILLAFGTVDVTYMLYDWALANKAAYAGAHKAILSNPVAQNITALNYDPTQLGKLCFNLADGTSTNICPSAQTTCTPAAGAGGTCANATYVFDDNAFKIIFTAMSNIFPRLQRQNVTISYATDNTYPLGFDGRPGGLPMDVTVSINGMTHQMYFLGPIMGFFGSGFAANPPIPKFATTLTSEDMVTN